LTNEELCEKLGIDAREIKRDKDGKEYIIDKNGNVIYMD